MASAYNMEVNVLIAGAGPAGSTLSLYLCKQQLPHLIIDKSVFPRDKICGDALSGKSVEVLNNLDAQFIKELEIHKNNFLGSYGVKFVSPNSAFIDIPFKKNLSDLKSAPGFISKRVVFDNFLFKNIDRNIATVFENCQLEDVQYENNGLVCTAMQHGRILRIHTKILVGAEGDRSIVARKLAGIEKEDNHYCAGLRAYYANVTGFHEKNFIELHFIKELLPGYLWVFPLPDGEANVGVGMLSKEVSRRKINLKKIMQTALQQNATLKHRFSGAVLQGEIKGWGLPLGSKRRRLSGDHFLLTGDAASLIDPFTGEGIGNAMLSSKIAAQHIAKALEAHDYTKSFFRNYDEEIYRLMWPELKLSRALQKLSKHAWLFNYVVSKAQKSARLRDTITCMFEDLEVRDRLRSPKFYLGLLMGK
jgi:geranylgeranyl reductase family protein